MPLDQQRTPSGVSAPFRSYLSREEDTVLPRFSQPGNAVKTRSVALQVLLPAFAVPQFQVIAHTQQHHLMLESGELHQPIRREDAARAINIHRLSPRKVETAEHAGLIPGLSLIERFGLSLQTFLRVKPQRFVGPRRHVERVGVAQLLAQPPG